MGAHNFSPFKDGNPVCRPDQRYKALGMPTFLGAKLFAYQSPDGIHWKLMQAEPVITEGAFDSQNLGFWDSTRQRYVDFHRGWRGGVRDIMTSTSTDFLHWTEPAWVEYPGAAKDTQLYTNQVVPYYRAPHVFLGFPMRFIPWRTLVPDADTGVSDGLFMTSRDGVHFHRWDEAFIRPGLQMDRWVQRNNMTAWGVVQTKSDVPEGTPELSIYSTESYCVGKSCRLRRFTLRLDGFVSLRANYRGGEMTTRPLKFAGKTLELNYSTSAAGSIRVEIQDAAGKPIPGFALEDCPEVFGDRFAQAVAWKHENDLSRLAGRPVRVRLVMKDADLYAVRFR